MVCNEYTIIKEVGGFKYVKGTIYADTMPVSLPEDGTDVDGLSAEIKFAVGMTIFTPNGTKMLFPGGWEDI